MDWLVLSRLQFATTVIYHYLFVPLTLGLVVLIALMETLYVVHGKDTYRRMAMFWGQLYLINYALGVRLDWLRSSSLAPTGPTIRVLSVMSLVRRWRLRRYWLFLLSRRSWASGSLAGIFCRAKCI